MQQNSQSQLGPQGISMQPFFMPAGFLLRDMLLPLEMMETGLVPSDSEWVEEMHISGDYRELRIFWLGMMLERRAERSCCLVNVMS